MKKLVLLLLVLLAINLISAIEIKLSKDTYSPSETLQAEITGNFIDVLTIDNIFLYKEGIPRTMPSISDLTKQGDIYYLYIVLPNQEGNFSIKIENTRYTDGGVEKTSAIIKEFTVRRTNESALQINPGFVRTSEDFSIKVKALNENQKITTNFNGKTQNLSLIEDVEKTIQFSILNLDFGKYNLKINDYNIPVFLIEKIIINNTTNQTTNQTNQTNINQTTNITEPKINITNKTEDEVKALVCSDFGKECGDNEECDVETKPALDSGSCCPGTCVEKKKTSYTWIGVLLILVVLSVVAYLYFKAKKRRPPTSEEILKSKSERFEERMSGDDENREVSGKLGSI